MTVKEQLERGLNGRYKIERELGEGGMAVVFLAHDPRHDRLVALKVLKPEISVEVGAERFLREIKLAARLTHPHILPVYDSGEAEGLLFYVMPNMEGQSLRERLDRERQLPVVPMMVLRDDECLLAPDDDFVLAPEDELLLSGEAGARRALGMTLVIDATREYVVTGRYVPASWAWRRLTGYRPEAR